MTSESLAATGISVHVRAAGVSGDFSLALSGGDVSVAEVLDALGLTGEQVTIDGEPVPAPATTDAVAVLRPGSCIGSLAGRDRREDESQNAAAVELSHVAGLDAGSTKRIGRGLYRVGVVASKPDSGWYLEIDQQPQLTDNSRPWHEHGSSIESLSNAAGAYAVSRPVDSEAGDGRRVVRPPRRVPPAVVTPITLGEPPAQVQPRASLSWATLLAPVPIALAMAFFFRPIFALFAAMGPVMALFRWYESKRRHRRDTRRRTAEVAAVVARIDQAADEQAEQIARLKWLSQPHVAELWKRARLASVRLWERRPTSSGFLEVSIGVGSDRVDATTEGDSIDREVHARLAVPLLIRSVPHTLSLVENTGVGVYGERTEILAVARSLVLQLATLQGPADLAIGVICPTDHASHWDWMKWLPHTDKALVGSASTEISRHLARITATETNQTVVLVVDDHNADVAAVLRAAQHARQDVRILAVASHPTLLPAACSSLVHVHGSTAELTSPELNSNRAVVRTIGLSLATATAWARSLGALTDPESDAKTRAQSSDVSLSNLLGNPDGAELAMRWARRPVAAPPVVPLGMAGDGPFIIDLTRDGPHALIAGTTGSGKSELLRTIVVALAAECPPDHLHVVLIDFKGGGAFDAVADLPHVAGLLTDLDEGLVRRAVMSLRAELERRERLFRTLAVSEYEEAAAASAEPLPRLLIAIDEFAALAATYPMELDAIVDLAARGRSLGMHLLLATQRPSGVVDQKIRANTNLRIALRVQDPFDSHDVVGTKEAASFASSCPGVAMVRSGSAPAVRMQTAFSGRSSAEARRCSVRPHALFASADSSPSGAHSAAGAETELDSLVGSIVSAGASWGCNATPLWLPPLPASLSWSDMRQRGTLASGPCENGSPLLALPLGLVDEPAQRRQAPWCWQPDLGPLAIYAGSAECSGQALVAIGAAMAAHRDAAATHLYVIDGDAGGAEPLRQLAHVGAFVSLDDRDRIERTVRFFEETIIERRALSDSTGEPRRVLLIDNLSAVVAAFDDVAGSELVRRLGALARDGSPSRVHLVVTARTARDIGHRLAQHIPHRLVLSLADPSGYLTLGIRSRDVVELPKMRAIDLVTKSLVQLALPPDLSDPASLLDAPRVQPSTIASFPEIVRRDQIPPATCSDGILDVPVGIEAQNLGPAILPLRPREHTLIAAAAGMGRSSLACAILRQLVDTPGPLRLGRICLPESAMAAASMPGEYLPDGCAIEHFVDSGDAPSVVAVDDPEWLDDEVIGAIHAAMKSGRDIRIIAATTPGYARSPRAWIHDVRRSQTGVLLGAHHSEGDLFRARLQPLEGSGLLPGRGFLIVRGRARATQFAHGER